MSRREDFPDEPRPSREPGPLQQVTSLRMIVVAAISGMVIAYFVLATLDVFSWTQPLAPWSLLVVLVVFAIASFVYARILNKRKLTEVIPAQEGLVAVALAKSLIFTAAILAGGHLVYILANITKWDIPGPRERTIHGIAILLGSALAVVSGSFLERACVIDPGDQDEENSFPADPKIK